MVGGMLVSEEEGDAYMDPTRTYPGARGFRPGKTHSYPPALQREQISSSGFVNVHFICAPLGTKQSKKWQVVSGIPTRSTLMT